ncbi:MAG TPA: SpoIID/LytB domain-containing protein [Longimicrobiales bacterium]
MRPSGHHRFVPLMLLALLSAAGCSESLTGPEATGDPRVVVLDPSASLQATPAGYVRIGVVPSATSIVIGSPDGDFTVTNKETGAVLFGGGGDVRVELMTAGSVRTRWWLQTACTGNVAFRDDWIARAQGYGYETMLEFVPSASCWRLLLGSWPPSESFSARVGHKNTAISRGLAAADAFWRSITTVSGETQLRLQRGGVERVVDAPVVLESASDLVTIAGAPYRGRAEVWTNSGGTLAGINEVRLEEYLYGVVPRELPPEPYGLAEAQKAQAVAARTYALRNLGKRATDGYDLLPTQSDQVYGGYAAEHPVSTAAVDATTGVVGTYDGQLISMLYSSTSGGWTANSEDVFSTAEPYLRGTPDAERGSALDRMPNPDVFVRHANATNLRAHAAGDFESDWSRYHRWTVTWTAAEMAEMLSGVFGTTITSVHAIDVTDRAQHGRVREIVFRTDAGDFTATKDGIRSRLQYPTATGDFASLRSTLFYIEPITDRGGEITGWQAWGGGWGHGVGMSQTGAVGMAQRRHTYDEILAHYYRGIVLETRAY